MKSMTGYALTEKHLDNATISLEIKSYNSRFLDIGISLPFWLSGLEPLFKSFISSNVSRGKIEVYLRLNNVVSNVDISANTDVALAYITAMKKIAEVAGIAMSIDLARLVEKDGVLSIEKNIDLQFWQDLLMPIFQETIINYNLTRTIEGDALKKDILSNLEKILSSVEIIKTLAPKMEGIFINSIKTKLKEFSSIEVDGNRIMQEAALMLVKYTINEEIIRLEAHCKNLQNELEANIPIGKKIDFICQEINREINTIGSKNQMIETTDAIITVKDALENIREQAKNVE